MEKIACPGLTAGIRRKALQLAAGLLVVGTIFMLRHRPAFMVFYCLSAAVFASGILCPRIISPLLAGLDKAITGLTRLVAVALLIVFYFLVITPSGLLQKALGGREKTTGSYWRPKTPGEQGPGTFERQF